MNSLESEFEISADKPCHPASLTKLATLFLTFEALDQGRLRVDQRIPVSEAAKSVPGTKLGITGRATILVHDAVMATATVSANDTATCLAEAVAGTVGSFVRQMNALCRRLGLRSTRFRTPTGLFCVSQMSTARDVAVLAAELYRHFPHHAHWLAQRSFVFDDTVRHCTNTLLYRCPDLVGGKTGRIPSSGWNLAVIARRDGRGVAAVVRGVAAVVMGCSTRADRDVAALRLLDRVFSRSDSCPEPILGADRNRLVSSLRG